MSCDPASDFFEGNLPEPTFRAEPGSVVTKGIQVTILCEGTSGALEYRLLKEGESDTWNTQTPLEPGNKAEFSTPHNEWSHAGDTIVTIRLPLPRFYYSKPSLSVQHSPVVALGGNIALHCVSRQRYDRFVLQKEGPQELSWTLNPSSTSSGEYQALFSVGPVAPSHKWRLRCYGYNLRSPQLWSEPSDPLELLISGQSKKPSLLIHPGPILAPGQFLTLQYCSDISYNRFALLKEKETDLLQKSRQHPQAGLFLADFLLGPVKGTTGGRYKCYGAQGFSPEWSTPSEPMDILIAGQLPFTPSLSVQTGPTVSSGENVTLVCQSQSQVDSFFLTKEGAAHPPLHLNSVLQAGQFQAEFSMSTVTLAFGGTYRCYGSRSSSPYLLSYPSDPVKFATSGSSGNSST
ncbi:leukocyte immunoglobulin-like receptor subfamily A member 6 [Nannospalax galili]|uniref:leukocyte immunoglobulin-like receptor subfamily A member 6 n=1 Tax=Nannospalax galili TaxID=1026970 RepID=UPI00081A23FD|nr:leukocyte immunoglobulin-like receptor subfamily A member 6 [Nannospalax galili]